jgi:hypothetical protein
MAAATSGTATVGNQHETWLCGISAAWLADFVTVMLPGLQLDSHADHTGQCAEAVSDQQPAVGRHTRSSSQPQWDLSGQPYTSAAV